MTMELPIKPKVISKEDFEDDVDFAEEIEEEEVEAAGINRLICHFLLRIYQQRYVLTTALLGRIF